MTAGLSQELIAETNFNYKKHCLQKVELTKDGSQAVEITPGECPADNAIVKEPKISLPLYVISKKAKRLSGEQHFYKKQAPVGTIVENQITDFCMIDTDLSDMCEVIADNQGIIDSVEVRPEGFLKHIERLQQDATNDRRARENREQSINEAIAQLKLDSAEQLKKAVADLTAADVAIRADLDKAINKFDLALQMTNQLIESKDAETKKALAKAIEDARNNLNAVAGRLDEKDRDVLKAIDVLTEKLDALSARVKKSEDALKDLSKALEAKEKALSDRIDALSDALKTASDEIKALIKMEVEALTKAVRDLTTTVNNNDKAAIDKAAYLDKAIKDTKAALDGKDVELQKALDKLNEEVSNLKKRMDTAEKGLADAAASLDSKEKDLAASIKKVEEALKASSDELKEKIRTEVEALTKMITDLKTLINNNDKAAKDKAAEIKAAVEEAKKKLGEKDTGLQNALDSMKEEARKLAERVTMSQSDAQTALQKSLGDLSAELKKADTEIYAALGKKATDLMTAINGKASPADIQASAKALTEEITKAKGDLTAKDVELNKAIVAVEGKLKPIDESVTKLGQELTQRIQSLESNYPTLDGKYNTAVGELKKAVEALTKADSASHKAAGEKLVQIISDLENYAAAVKANEQAKADKAMAEAKAHAEALKKLDVSFEKAMADMMAAFTTK